MLITASFHMYYVYTNTHIEIGVPVKINPADFADKDEMYNYIYTIAVKVAKISGNFDYNISYLEYLEYYDEHNVKVKKEFRIPPHF
jgi:hypothetical protein